MPRTAGLTDPTPPDHQQMDRSNDPEITRAMDAAAPELAMSSRRQRFAGSAAGVGSVGFEESGAFEIGGEDPHDDPVVEAPTRSPPD